MIYLYYYFYFPSKKYKFSFHYPKANAAFMKLFLFFLLGFVSLTPAFTQDAELHVVSSAGSSYQLNDVVLDWTLGEVVIQTLERPTGMITQGFHQPTYTLVSVSPIPDELGNVVVSPNPFFEEVSITLSFTKPEKGVIKLFDMTGKELWKKGFEGNSVLEKYNASALSSGPYLLVVSVSDDLFVHTYKILKTQ